MKKLILLLTILLSLSLFSCKEKDIPYLYENEILTLKVENGSNVEK